MHELDDVRHWYAGDSRTLAYTVQDADGNTIDITNADLSWWLFPKEYQSDSADAVLDDGDAGVTITKTTPASGEFEVDVAEGATDTITGEHWQRILVDPQDDTRQQWVGRVILES